MNNKAFNLLPDSELEESKKALKKSKKKKSGAGFRMVVPTIKGKGHKKDSGKKKSWWQRRKESRLKKKEHKLKAKGETAIKTPSTHHKKISHPKAEIKPNLFSDTASVRKEADFLASYREKDQPQGSKPVPPTKHHPAPPPPVVKEKEEPVVVSKFAKEPLLKKMHQPERDGEYSGPPVNLVPEYVSSQVYGQPWILTASVLVIVLAIWVIISGITISHVNKVEAQVAQKQAELVQLQVVIKNFEAGKDAADSLQKQFSAVEGLIDEHIYWLNFLDELEGKTIPDVYYVNVSSQQFNEVSLGAIAKNYAAAARQIRVFERSTDVIKEVSVNEVRVEVQPGSKLPVPIVAFTVKLVLQPDVLFERSK